MEHSNFNIQNNLSSSLSLDTQMQPGGYDPGNGHWGITATSALSGTLTQYLWVPRSLPYPSATEWITNISTAGVRIQLYVEVSNDDRPSSMYVNIQVEGINGQSGTDWQTDDASTTMVGFDSKTYTVSSHWFLNGTFDDVTFTISVAS
jgi:hypothetical protein